MKKPVLLLAALALTAGARAGAWGDLGHEVTALVAYRQLLPNVRANLDALLASDGDALTAPDFAARSTWADKYRIAHRETAAWHFVDIEIVKPDLPAACFGFPALAADQPASQGPPQDCVVNKIEEFARELGDPKVTSAERLLAFKFLIHFVGDLHQPLHAADHQDRGGNCISLAPPQSQLINLHAYWDVGVVEALGASAPQIAERLTASLDAAQAAAWIKSAPREWALESFAVGLHSAYSLAALPTCQDKGSVALSDEYKSQAAQSAATQLLKAGVRLAAVLNTALNSQ